MCIYAHLYTISERWVLVYWPGEDSTSVVLEDLLQDKGCHVHVGDDCNVRHLPQHKGKVAALGVL